MTCTELRAAVLPVERRWAVWNASATDALTHETAIAIARRCVWIIQAVLREEERTDALREFYTVAREELENRKGGPGREGNPS